MLEAGLETLNNSASCFARFRVSRRYGVHSIDFFLPCNPLFKQKLMHVYFLSKFMLFTLKNTQKRLIKLKIPN